MEILSWCPLFWSGFGLLCWSWPILSFAAMMVCFTLFVLLRFPPLTLHRRWLGSLFYLWLVLSSCCDASLLGVTGFLVPLPTLGTLQRHLDRIDSDILLPHAFPPSGFDCRLMLLDRVVNLSSASLTSIHTGFVRFASSTYPFCLQSFTPSFRVRGEMRRKYRLSKRHLKIWNSYIDGLDDDTVSTYLFELMLTPSLKTFDWKSVLDILGFDDEETPFVPRPRYLHLTGYGPHFSAFCSETLFDLAPFSTRPDIDLAPHPDDLTLEELGDDFSNLIRSHRLTPTTYSKLFNIRLDPTMFIEEPQACSSADPLLNIILDTGASHGLTMSSDDFVEITYGNFGSMSTAADENKFPIIGAGIVAYDAISKNGDLIRWTFPANLCKAAGSRLCSPQVCADYLNLDQRFPSFESNHVYASIKTDAIGGRLTVPIDHNVNLPLVKAKNVHVSTKVHSHANDPQCRCSTTNWCRCPLCTKPHDMPRATLADALNQQVVDPDDVLSTSNENLTTAQKHLLLDHQRLGHLNMRQIQNLYHCHETSPDSCLKPKGTGCLTCPLPKCRACLLGKAKRRPTKSTVKRPRSDAGHIPHDPLKLEPGDLVSIDHYESSVRGRLYHTKGRERAKHRFCGGTLFFDHASRAIFVYHQVSLGGSDTIRSKFSLETFASQVGRTIRRYHSDNGILTSDAFERSLQADHLEVKPLHTVSGVGAHHQNGGAERAIQTVTSMARTMMIHCHLHWPDGFSPNLWPMALDYAVWIDNHVPREDSTLSPMELFTGVKEHCSQLRCLRVWGCPSYVLDPRLQDGKKVPKWSPRARQGQFLGFLTQHSTTIGLIRNLTTNHISPQFHVVHDELFHTVHSSWEAPLGPIDLPDFFTRDTYLEDHCSDIAGTCLHLILPGRPLPDLSPPILLLPTRARELHALIHNQRQLLPILLLLHHVHHVLPVHLCLQLNWASQSWNRQLNWASQSWNHQLNWASQSWNRQLNWASQSWIPVLVVLVANVPHLVVFPIRSDMSPSISQPANGATTTVSIVSTPFQTTCTASSSLKPSIPTRPVLPHMPITLIGTTTAIQTTNIPVTSMTVCTSCNQVPLMALLTTGTHDILLPSLLMPITRHTSTCDTWTRKNKKNGSLPWIANSTNWREKEHSLLSHAVLQTERKSLTACGP